MIKAIEKKFYQTRDGEEFERIDDAVHHERVQAIAGMLDDSGMYFHTECASTPEIANWLITNFKRLNRVMEDI